ncbi:ribonuclease III domain-containing protein [Cyanobium sp. CH-040]|uniref:ribonuclease III family protein n=1 Tax=Cyanobium sp. CH-040 TaxID=2823708 RepID=UPI0028F41B5B|nr:ribonuclease III domain-containing protein [Cyanobium sp. CH-040]MCP9926621.1 ribonuclease III [Cyanobium sp. CH-040]
MSDRRQQLLRFLRDLGVEPGERDLAPVEEALTHTSARQRRNHERLEFLGDAVLRLAASEYLERHHAGLAVGRRSALRAQLVSDRWLGELGERCGIERVWRIGPMAAGDRAGRATVRAELCEALIGALYEVWGGAAGGLEPVHRWLTPHWQRSSAELLADPHRHNWKSALQEWSQGRGLGLPSYRCRELHPVHGHPERFQCLAELALEAGAEPRRAEGSGPSRRAAEQEAARALLAELRPAPGC